MLLKNMIHSHDLIVCLQRDDKEGNIFEEFRISNIKLTGVKLDIVTILNKIQDWIYLHI